MFANVAFFFTVAIGHFGLWNCIEISDRCTKERCKIDGQDLKFMLIGDWGGFPVSPYTSHGQWKVADVMGRAGQSGKTHFQMSLGDNFYWSGVADVDDKRFQIRRKDTFEKVYTHPHLLYTPWYIMAGNHDHRGNITAQVLYSKKYYRWIYPKLYYTFRYQTSDGVDVDFVVIDTILLCGHTLDGLLDQFQNFIFSSNSAPDGSIDKEKAEKQWTWIENQLKDSKAPYLFVAGHYPVYSTSSHGPTKCLIDRLNPLLKKYNATAYFAGHDHNLQHIQTTANGQTMNYVISGAGAFASQSNPHSADVPEGSSKFFYPRGTFFGQIFPVGSLGWTDGGFVYSRINRTNAGFAYVDGDGKTMYRFYANRRKF